MGQRIEELYYELSTRGQELAGLDTARAKLTQFTAFVRAHPIAAMGALGASLTLVGIKAAQAAAQAEAAVRRIATTVSDGATQLGRISDKLDQIAKETGVSRQALEATAQTIARNGVANTSDLLNRLRVVQQAADASGASLDTVATGLDQVLDVFGLAADKAELTTAKLFAIAKGKAPLEDVLQAIQVAAPGVRAAGLSFDEAAAALGALLNQGLNARQAGSELKALADLGKPGVARIKELAAGGVEAAKAMGELATAADLVGQSAERSGAKIREHFSTMWRDFGTQVLNGIVNPTLEHTLWLMKELETHGVAGRGSGLAMLARGGGATGHPTLATGQGSFAGAAAGRTGKTADQLKADADAARQAADALKQLRDQITGILTQSTASLVDDTDAAIRQLIQDAKAAHLPADELAAALGALTAARDSLAQDESIKTFLASLDESVVAVDRLRFGLNEVQRNLGLQQRLAESLPEGSQARADAEQRVKDLLDEQVKLLARIAALTGTNEVVNVQATKTATTFKEQLIGAASEMSKIARGALGIAQGLGIADAQATALLQNIVTIGDNLAGAFAKGPGQFTSVVAVVGGLIGAIGSALGGGPSPAEQARLEELKKNTDAIEVLTRSLGDFGKSTQSGNTIAAAQSALDTGLPKAIAAGNAAIRANPYAPLAFADAFSKSIVATLRALGLSFAEFQEAAKGLGVTIRDSKDVEGIKAFDAALKKFEIAQFTQSFTGQLQFLQDSFRAFDITDPAKQLQQTVDLLSELPDHSLAGLAGAVSGEPGAFGSPVIAAALKGLDLTTAEGRAAAEKATEALFGRLNLAPGAGGFSAADLGGLNAQQFEEALLQILELLRQTDGQAPGAGQSGFSVDRTITEARGSQLAALLASIDANTGVVAAWYTRASAGLQPPTLSAPTRVGAGDTITVTVGDIIVRETPGSDATATGAAVGAALVAAVNQELGAIYRRKRLASGDVLRT